MLIFSHYLHGDKWHPTPVLLPGKSHGWRSLVGCSLWGHKELDTTEWLHFHFSLSCIGEENGNPLQCSCLENPRDGGAWWAAIYGVAQSQTRLKRLSSSNSSSIILQVLVHNSSPSSLWLQSLYEIQSNRTLCHLPKQTNRKNSYTLHHHWKVSHSKEHLSIIPAATPKHTPIHSHTFIIAAKYLYKTRIKLYVNTAVF